MVLGVGIDEVEVERLATALAREPGLKARLFTPGEIRYCEARKLCIQHLAARFAAKEAFAKALGTGIADGVAFREIEVVPENDGRPGVRLHGKTRERAAAAGADRIHLSLTHTDTRAAAMVVIEAAGGAV